MPLLAQQVGDITTVREAPAVGGEVARLTGAAASRHG